MARKFAEITFTPSVKAAQTRYGSRAANEGFELAEDSGDTLGEVEAEFVEARDGFYQATVNENGWPYVQFRGGPAGFLKVLDERTIGYADFRGNIQYLSVGNLNANDRIALILMDYANRRRLKIWARVRIVHRDEDPALLARLEVPTYRARVERAVVMTIEAVDWNCPQHITPRFTESQIAKLVAPLRNRLAELEATAGEPFAAQSAIGDGPLELVITGIRQLTPEVRALLRERTREIVEHCAAAGGCEAEFELDAGYPATVNDPASVDVVRVVGREVFGADNVIEPPPMAPAEDFSYFLRERPAPSSWSAPETSGGASPHPTIRRSSTSTSRCFPAAPSCWRDWPFIRRSSSGGKKKARPQGRASWKPAIERD